MPDCIVVSQLPPPVHGSTLVTARLMRYLEARGVDVHLVDRRFSRDIAEVGRIGVRKLLSAVGLVWRFRAATRRSHATVIYFVTTRPGSFLIDWVVLRSARRNLRHHRAIAYVHTVGFESLSERGRWWERRVRQALECFDDVVVLGQTLGHDLERWVPADKLAVIPNVAEPDRVSVEQRAPSRGVEAQPDEIHVLFLSNLLEEKGATDFIEIAEGLPHGSATFMMAGHAGPPSFMDRVSKALGETSAPVDYRGPVNSDQRAELFAWADIMVFPSSYRYEAQPLVVIEAFAAGVPVIAYDVGGVRDLIRDGENGYLLEIGDVAGAVTLLSGLDRLALERLSQCALKTHARAHSPEAFEANWEALLYPRQESADLPPAAGSLRE